MSIFRSLLVLLLLFMLVPGALAHERHVYEIKGKQYLFVLGSLNEPVHTGDKSGVDFRVKLADPQDPGNSSAPNAQPVSGLEKTLQVEVQVDGEKNLLAFSPVYNKPGEYAAYFYPQKAMAYSYRIFGTLDGVAFDQTYACNAMGHVMNSSDDAMEMEVSPGVKETLMAGSFGCPKDREVVSFPKSSRDSATVISFLALVFSLIALARTRKK